LGNTAAATRTKKHTRTAGPKGKLYEEFWPPVIERVQKEFPGLLSRRRTPDWYGLGMSSGRRGIWFNVQFTDDKRLRATVYVTPNVGHVGDQAFDLLLAQKQEIEERFGAPLVWDQ